MMQRLLGPGVVLLLASLFTMSAAAIPISGKLEYSSSGTFIHDGSGNAIGFDYDGTTPNGDGDHDTGEQVARVGNATNDIATILGSTGDPVTGPLIEVFDFDLTSLPSFEWIADAAGLVSEEWHLQFQITDGGEVDAGDAQDDLAGSGILSLVCVDSGGCSDTTFSSYEDTLASWTLSDADGKLVVATTVPEPAPLGLLGLALIVWGISRRRMRGAA